MWIQSSLPPLDLNRYLKLEQELDPIHNWKQKRLTGQMKKLLDSLSRKEMLFISDLLQDPQTRMLLISMFITHMCILLKPWTR